jgi:hypothetical protein
LVADLRRYYQVDLLDVFREGTSLTPRYVLMLVEHLPDDSALFAAMRGGKEHRPWTVETHLLTAVVNLLNAANRQRAGLKTRKPLVEPPKTKKRKPAGRTVTVAQIKARAAAALKQTTGR